MMGLNARLLCRIELGEKERMLTVDMSEHLRKDSVKYSFNHPLTKMQIIYHCLWTGHGVVPISNPPHRLKVIFGISVIGPIIVNDVYLSYDLKVCLSMVLTMWGIS